MHRLLAGCVAAVLAVPMAAQKPSKEMIDVITAYAAKVTASAIFVSGRTLESVKAQEFLPTKPFEALLLPLLTFDVDHKLKEVTARVGNRAATAMHAERLGCTILKTTSPNEETDLIWRAFNYDETALADWGPNLASHTSADIDAKRLASAIEDAFAEPHERAKVHTRAIVVLHQGKLIAERYADGFHAEMPLPGWSMTKTLTHALLGARVQQGKFDLDAPPPIEAWRNADDARRDIRVRHLLQMDAGITWSENYDDPNSDALRMLFASSDHASVYTGNALATKPGTKFRYSSGATNTICWLLRKTFEKDTQYWSHATDFFRRLGMRTAVLEADPSGTFVGSSYGYASARDWAKLGLLYLQDGVYDGKRILPEGWVDAARTPTPVSDGRYGQGVWLNADPDGDGPRQRHWPDLPADLFHMDGHEGQYVMISPSAELVIVRLGCTKNGGFRLTQLLREVHAAVAR